MHDPRLDRLAQVLVQYSAAVKPGDLVTIIADPGAMPAVEAVYAAVLQAGAHPSYHPKSERLRELLFQHASDDQLRHVCPFEAHRLATCDVLLVLQYHHNTRFLGRVDPAKIAMAQAARRNLFSGALKRGAAGALRYTLTELPSHAAAQEAGMSLADYEDWVFRAGFLHLPDPVAAWRALHAQQELVTRFLQTKSILRFRTPPRPSDGAARAHDGTDLTVDVTGRTWINCAGTENFPDGEVFTGPQNVNGIVNFNLPSVYQGQEVDGVRLRFRDGRVVDASAARNEPYLFAMLDQDDGARNVGEIAIGTNYHLAASTKSTFFDEKIGGTFHLALGAGFPETGNANVSALHWDMVCDLRPGASFPNSSGGAIHADNEFIHADGNFLFPGRPGL